MVKKIPIKFNGETMGQYKYFLNSLPLTVTYFASLAWEFYQGWLGWASLEGALLYQMSFLLEYN